MNKMLFFSTLVCISCMSGSQYLQSSTMDEPQPGPTAERCLNNVNDIIAYGCVASGFSRWHLNKTNPESDLHRFCCHVYDLADCIRVAVEAPNHCTPEERGATNEFLYQAAAHVEKGQCGKHPRHSEKCINL